MRQIILFLKNNKDFLSFLLFCLISFVSIFSYNSYHNFRFLKSSSIISASLLSKTNDLSSYLHLREQNQSLEQENRNLYQRLLDLNTEVARGLDIETEIEFSPLRYKAHRAEVVKNSVKYTKNFLLLNKGSKDLIGQDMGVVSSKGIVGIVTSSSKNYSVVMSVLNKLSKISVSLKKNGQYGSLSWNGKDTDILQLTDIPNSVEVFSGDTIVTDSRSTIFPKGIPVGVVHKVNKNPYDKSLLLQVKLFTDMENLHHVYILKKDDILEIKELEEEINKQISDESKQ